jgi:hypothetical protein
VIDLPYVQPPKRNRRHKDAGQYAGAASTGDVAQILEAKYRIMELFFEAHKGDIEDALLESLGGDIESVLMGKVPGSNSFAAAESRIAELFRNFITLREIEGMGQPGIPTEAAIKGINHRLKHPYAKANPRRSSFDDTGLYLDCFRAWLENN